VDSLVSLNGIKSIKALKAGTELKVPNMDGIIHIVAKGQSLGSIARSYHTELTALADVNDLGSGSIRPGQTLFIPGARLPQETLRRIYGTSVIWPGRGPISSWFGYRADPFTGVRRYHAGIDIVVPLGTPIKAAMDGVVADAGYNGNYGNYVILNHGDGMQTLYGHLTSYSVRPGQRLAQGSILGLSGNTGYSTGPHLHFGVYRGGVAVDPLKVLK
jgi:murein DD-endopeptidase MepM/ murein hydrolase activator NlpD